MTFPDYLMTPAALLCAVVLDKLFGDPRRFHPLAGFGRIAAWLEARVNPHTDKPSPQRRRDAENASNPENQGAASIPPRFVFLRASAPLRLTIFSRILGTLAVLLLLAPFTAASYFISQIPFWGWLAQTLLLYFALGMTSLAQHARAVQNALDANDLDTARTAVGMIVSRDTGSMRSDDAARATIESVLENGNDAVFGAVFWFVLLGAPGAVAYRLVNTLDAMWGYRTPRYFYFGWAAARLDDVLNIIPARLTALTYALLGNARKAFQCWRAQARLWYSPNAGPVMASGAGALGVVLGGAAMYHGASKERPTLGIGQPAQATDIGRAISLVQRGLCLWIVVAFIGAALHA
ncbi:MAG: adenosylcobinamide-phosphate synthase CbiB [Burkholderiales bacterium]|nr:adenosylcobinamide-phosphate synthase CbiB [Burkholderiales bacterium]